jgi:hypothetical protein
MLRVWAAMCVCIILGALYGYYLPFFMVAVAFASFLLILFGSMRKKSGSKGPGTGQLGILIAFGPPMFCFVIAMVIAYGFAPPRDGSHIELPFKNMPIRSPINKTAP